jgi:hypothetical protein
MCAAFYDKVRQSQIKVRQSSGAQKDQESMSANVKEGELRMIVSANVVGRQGTLPSRSRFSAIRGHIRQCPSGIASISSMDLS